MAMIKCPECRHHISSMAKACPECGAPIDPDWAKAEAEKEMKKLEEVPFTVEVDGKEYPVEPETIEPEDEIEEEADGEKAPSAEDSADNDAPSSSVEKPKKKNRGIFVFLVVLLGLCIGGLYYYDYESKQQREERAYELLQDCSNPAFYEDFIVRFPKSRHIEDVRERLQVVLAQQNEWEKLIASGNRQELQQFVAEHPTSPYVKVAQGRIDSLDWAEAQNLRTVEAVTFYMTTHPDGYYIDQAETLRQILVRQREEAAALAAAERDSLANESAQALVQP